jgi:hypothetical protein
LRHVSKHLGNTPAVCRSSYVFPVVLQRFEEGRVLGYAFNGDVRRAREVERSERALLKLLGKEPWRVNGVTNGSSRSRALAPASVAAEPALMIRRAMKTGQRAARGSSVVPRRVEGVA